MQSRQCKHTNRNWHKTKQASSVTQYKHTT